MNPIEKKVVIYVKRNEDNKPYALVYYQNGEELLPPTGLDLPTQVFANYIAKKTVTNEIQGVIYSYTEKRTVDRFDISPLTDKDYCIAGSEIGRKHTADIIKRINEAASSKEVLAPVYVTDGENNVLMNDELFRTNSSPMQDPEQKYRILENILSEEKVKVLYKAA
ncbi:MAG: hypothetical protein II625_09825 [Bacilli bacterium]|nr:hypothetical protein [Bacilli bacterium]